jgi:DNA-binding beta-propeller fold protein YncE
MRRANDEVTTMGLARIFLLLCGLVMAACTQPEAQPAEAMRMQSLVWPRAPAQPRVRFVRNVASPADWGLTRGAMQGVIDRFTGEKPFRFVRPTGVAQRDGTLYVADPGAQALVILDMSQSREIVVSRVGNEALASPVAVALGPDGGVIVADSALGKVFVLDAKGALRHAIGGESRLTRPAGLAYDAGARRLYVADAAAHRIVVYSPEGQFIASFGRNGAAPGEFNFPTHLALTRDGALIIDDTLNFRVQVVDRDGAPLRHFGRVGDGSGEFASPKGVATDSEGDIYVVDALFDAVQIFTHEGALLLGFGERGTKAGQLWLPNGLFIGAGDRIYVADAYNRRIAIFEPVRGAAEVKP